MVQMCAVQQRVSLVSLSPTEIMIYSVDVANYANRFYQHFEWQFG